MLRKKIGSYYLVEKIGSGGMSDVYLAIDPKTRQKRAYKILKKRVTKYPSDYTRFLREIEIIGGLSHPDIIKIYDNGVLEDCYFYSMEYMSGGNLSQSMGRERVDFIPAVKLFLRICSAMAHAHDKGVIHRDLKPSNILLRSAGNPVISDFGIAKTIAVEKSALTQTGEILGTIAYLAPEQRYDTKRIDQRADVYALGAILYEMLMGFPPLGKFPWPRDVLPEFPESLQSILEKCLAIKPGSRFANAGILERELEKCKEFEEIDNKAVSERPYMNVAADETRDTWHEKTDRIETWLNIMRSGTTRERLAAIRDMVDTIEASEIKAVLKLYSGENDRVRWGLIRVLGELKITSATPLILNDIKSPFHAECAIEALGKIGACEAFDEIHKYIEKHPESALIALIPLAQTGKEKAIPYIRHYLNHEMSVLRQASVRALASIKTEESLKALKEHTSIERDDKVRSSLLEAVYTMESSLLPHLNVPDPNPVIIQKGRSA
ncbi:MAG: protein kinase [Acidobacteria bacterium]|nr:protein kinase [Acidobacteriota bacterium]